MESGRRLGRFAGELVVPLIMAVFLAAYWWQAAGLSSAAVTFPGALSVALVAMLLGQIVVSLREPPSIAPEANSDPVSRRERVGTIAQRFGILGLAAALFFFWRELGGTLVVYLFTLGAFVLLGERRAPLLAVLPAALAVALSYLFKVVLKVRFPDGVFSLF